MEGADGVDGSEGAARRGTVAARPPPAAVPGPPQPASRTNNAATTVAIVGPNPEAHGARRSRRGSTAGPRSGSGLERRFTPQRLRGDPIRAGAVELFGLEGPEPVP